MKDGAILTKNGDNIQIIAIDSYDKLSRLLDIYKEIAGEDIKLVRVVGYNMESLKTNQDKLNEAFANSF